MVTVLSSKNTNPDHQLVALWVILHSFNLYSFVFHPDVRVTTVANRSSVAKQSEGSKKIRVYDDMKHLRNN